MLARTFVALVAGAALSLAFEPVAIAYLMPLSLAALALTTRDLRARSGFVVGLVFGIGFYFPHIYWMSSSIGAVAWIALAGIEAFFHGLFGAAAAVLHRLRAWPFWLAGAWLTMEFTRSTWPFSGMPWGRLGFGVVDTPLAPTLAYVGVNGVSLIVATIGFIVARLVVSARGDERLYATVGLVGLTSVAVVPSVVPWTLPTRAQTTVAAVQGDVPGAGNDILEDAAEDELVFALAGQCELACTNAYILAMVIPLALFILEMVLAAVLFPFGILIAMFAIAQLNWALTVAGAALNQCLAACDGVPADNGGGELCGGDICQQDEYCWKGVLGIGKDECRSKKKQGNVCSNHAQCNTDCCKLHTWSNPVSKTCRPANACN